MLPILSSLSPSPSPSSPSPLTSFCLFDTPVQAESRTPFYPATLIDAYRLYETVLSVSLSFFLPLLIHHQTIGSFSLIHSLFFLSPLPDLLLGYLENTPISSLIHPLDLHWFAHVFLAFSLLRLKKFKKLCQFFVSSSVFNSRHFISESATLRFHEKQNCFGCLLKRNMETLALKKIKSFRGKLENIFKGEGWKVWMKTRKRRDLSAWLSSFRPSSRSRPQTRRCQLFVRS